MECLIRIRMIIMITDIEKKVVDLLVVDKALNDYSAFVSSISKLEDWGNVSLNRSTKKDLANMHRNLREEREALIKEICGEKKE